MTFVCEAFNVFSTSYNSGKTSKLTFKMVLLKVSEEQFYFNVFYNTNVDIISLSTSLFIRISINCIQNKHGFTNFQGEILSLLKININPVYNLTGKYNGIY